MTRGTGLGGSIVLGVKVYAGGLGDRASDQVKPTQSDDVRFGAFACSDISVGRLSIPAVFVSRSP